MNYQVVFEVNENIYHKNPFATELGKNVVKHSVEMMAELGFEAFTFKKLAERMSTTEASVYRYFENKHKLFLYLVAWYWEWIGFQIDMSISKLETGQEKLDAVLKIVSRIETIEMPSPFINEEKLTQLVTEEGMKAYHLKGIDEENKKGNLMNFKGLVTKIAELIDQQRPDFKHSRSFATLLLETSLNQSYYADHLPKLSSLSKEQKNTDLYEWLSLLCTRVLQTGADFRPCINQREFGES